MIFVGIDPGLDGALAAWEGPGAPIVTFDMPTFRIGKRRVVDALWLAREVPKLTAGKRAKVWLEQAMPHPNDGRVAAFGNGQNYGILRGVLAANFLEIVVVSPASWKRAMRVTGDKDECRAAASAMFPEQSALFARKKDDGRAEAALIAVYGSRQHV